MTLGTRAFGKNETGGVTTELCLGGTHDYQLAALTQQLHSRRFHRASPAEAELDP